MESCEQITQKILALQTCKYTLPLFHMNQHFALFGRHCKVSVVQGNTSPTEVAPDSSFPLAAKMITRVNSFQDMLLRQGFYTLSSTPKGEINGFLEWFWVALGYYWSMQAKMGMLGWIYYVRPDDLSQNYVLMRGPEYISLIMAIRSTRS